MRVGGLFSGIGGMELGLQRAGFEIAWMCEIDPFCRRVLANHWPGVPIYEDVRELTADAVESVDLISGGFPCQDISRAGSGAGIDGDRSGLWSEIARLVCAIRPRYVLVENVAALLDRGLGRVLSDLSAIRYDAEWSTVSACSVGTPHMRQRVFVVAYPNGQHGREGVWNTAARSLRPVQAIYDLEGARARWRARLENPSALYGGADGVPFGMDRNRAIGNAVVPQVVEQIGRAIMIAHQSIALLSARSSAPPKAESDDPQQASVGQSGLSCQVPGQAQSASEVRTEPRRPTAADRASCEGLLEVGDGLAERRESRLRQPLDGMAELALQGAHCGIAVHRSGEGTAGRPNDPAERPMPLCVGDSPDRHGGDLRRDHVRSPLCEDSHIGRSVLDVKWRVA